MRLSIKKKTLKTESPRVRMQLSWLTGCGKSCCSHLLFTTTI